MIKMIQGGCTWKALEKDIVRVSKEFKEIYPNYKFLAEARMYGFDNYSKVDWEALKAVLVYIAVEKYEKWLFWNDLEQQRLTKSIRNTYYSRIEIEYDLKRVTFNYLYDENESDEKQNVILTFYKKSDFDCCISFLRDFSNTDIQIYKDEDKWNVLLKEYPKVPINELVCKFHNYEEDSNLGTMQFNGNIHNFIT